VGVKIGDLVVKHPIKVKDLTGRKIAIDAPNILYQFLSSIRQSDGSPLTDSEGNVTSHLTGLLYRTSNLLACGIKPVFVFDGKPPEIKGDTLSKRKEVKEKAQKEWMKALEEEDFAAAKKAAQATSRLTSEMVEHTKEALDAMGIPWVQAPMEGESQAAYMAQKGDVWATGSTDYDALLFATPILIRYLSIGGKRKLPGKNIYINVEPEQINLADSLKKLEITQEQLIDIGILIGTDFNYGVKGIGPKTALKLIKEGKTIEECYKMKDQEPEVNIQEVRDIFLKPNIVEKYKLEWKKPDHDKMVEVFVEKHDFSHDRVMKVCDKICGIQDSKNQSRLGKWF